MAVVTTLPTTPPQRRPTPAAPRPGLPRRGLGSRLNSSPGRLSVMMGVLIALGLLAGIVAVIGVSQRGNLVDSVRTNSGPQTVSAQQLYRSLSDADATAAAAFLSSGAEPADLRSRYQQDIAAASAALAGAEPATAKGRDAVAQLSQSLPVYAGLVETARSYNRLGLPVGAAYLREASTLMRGTLLPAAATLYQEEAARLDDEGHGAAAVPWLALLLVVLTLVALIVVQRSLSRRTRRTLNVGLGAATAAGLALLLWLGISWIGSASHLDTGRKTGSDQVALLAQARIAALQARADEALTLVARGGGGDYEKDFQTNMTALIGSDGNGGLLARARDAATDPVVRHNLADVTDALKVWKQTHTELRAQDDGGDYPAAVSMALDAKAGTAFRFNQVDTNLDRAIAATSAAFDAQAGRAGGSLRGAGFAFGALTLILLVGVAAGLTQRIAEYR